MSTGATTSGPVGGPVGACGRAQTQKMEFARGRWAFLAGLKGQGGLLAEVQGLAAPSDTFVVTIDCDGRKAGLSSFLSTILGTLPGTGRVFVVGNTGASDVVGGLVTGKGAGQAGRSRVRPAGELFACEPIQMVDVSSLTGKSLWIFSITRKAGQKRLSCYVRSFDVDDLFRLEVPVCLPLLISGFYVEPGKLSWRSKDAPLPRALSGISHGGKASADDYLRADTSFRALATYAQERYRACSYGVRKRVLAQLSSLWAGLRACYFGLSLDEKGHAGDRPSPASYASLVLEYPDPCHVGTGEGAAAPSGAEQAGGDPGATEQASGGPGAAEQAGGGPGAAEQAGGGPEGAPLRGGASEEIDITVIMPVFNACGAMYRCIYSILNQQGVRLEVICVNDGSKDASVEELEANADTDPRIRVFSQLNGGAGSARNFAIGLARGEWLAFIDADDYYPDLYALAKLLSCARAHKARMCGGSFGTIGGEGEVTDVFTGAGSFYTFADCSYHAPQDYGSDYGWIRFIYHRSLFEDGTLRFPERLWYEDPVFLLQALYAAGGYATIPDLVYRYQEGLKETRWTSPKVCDLLWGIAQNADMAVRHGDLRMIEVLRQRIEVDYRGAIQGALGNVDVVEAFDGVCRRLGIEAAL